MPLRPTPGHEFYLPGIRHSSSGDLRRVAFLSIYLAGRSGFRPPEAPTPREELTSRTLTTLICASALLLTAGGATAIAHGSPDGHGWGDRPDHGGGPPPWAHGQGSPQDAPAPPTPPPAPPANPAPAPIPTPPAPTPTPAPSDGGSQGDHGNGNGHGDNGNGNNRGNGNPNGYARGHDGSQPGHANHGTNTPPATTTPALPSPTAATPVAAPAPTATTTQTPIAVPPGIATPTLTTAPTTITTTAPTATPITTPTLPIPGITITSLEFPATRGTGPRTRGRTPAAAGAATSVLAASPLSFTTGATALDSTAGGLPAATHAAAASGAIAAHDAPAPTLRASTSPAATIAHFIEVIPIGVWIALAVAISLAAMGGGAAVTLGRRASRRASEVAAVTAAAVTDQLTGLLNRRGFTQSAERELERARRYSRPLALAYIDVRGLKAVNDTEGHLAGDRLLQEVATLLSSSARANDIVGRMGGDELAVLLAEQAESGAAAMSERIRDHVPEHRAALGLRTRWDVTIGTASFPGDGETLDELIAAADRRMYEQRGIELRKS